MLTEYILENVFPSRNMFENHAQMGNPERLGPGRDCAPRMLTMLERAQGAWEQVRQEFVRRFRVLGAGLGPP